MFWDKDRIDYVGNLDYAESVTLAFPVGQRVKVKRVILVGVEVGNGAEDITVKVGDADGAGSPVTIGTFTIPNGFAVDEVHFANIAERMKGPASVVGTPASATNGVQYTSGDGLVTVEPGQELQLISTGGTASTGQADVYVEYVPEAFNELASYALGKELPFTAA